MLVQLSVVQGPDKGKTYRYEGSEPANILVGREDKTSQAKWRLSPEDVHVSRNHFLLEIRPPNCFLSDPQSLNGTFLRRGGEEQKVEEALLENGDEIRVGQTILAVEVDEPPAEEGEEKGQQTVPLDSFNVVDPVVSIGKLPGGPDGAAPLMCIRCGGEVEELPALYGSNLRDLDFMCNRCRKVVLEERQQEAEERAHHSYYCQRCGGNVTKMATSDGRAAELADVALYLCPDCASQEKKGAWTEAVGGYHKLVLLGAGGMGMVFKAWHPQTGRLVALKMMKPIPKGRERMLLRFQREVSIMQGFLHTNLVALYEGGQAGDNPFFISEYVPGGDFSQFISDRGEPLLRPEQVVSLIGDALLGLDFFHRGQERHYVHRDLKAENLLLRRENDESGLGVAKVADFGFARCYSEHGGTITRTGEYAGTIMYMPPEQVLNFKRVQPPTDIYAIGVTVYYLLSGRFPLSLPTPWQLKGGAAPRIRKSPVRMVLEDSRKPLRTYRPDLPERLYRVVDRSLATAPEARFQTAEAFRNALLEAV